jgi:hypothetical protein
MRGRLQRFLLAVIALCALTVVIPSSANATTLYSIWGTYGPVLGIPYANQSFVGDNCIMCSGASVKSTNGTTIPAGWSGEQTTLYRNGALCASSSMYYYRYATTGWSGLGGTGYCGYGNYNTRGSTAAYNGNGYNYYYTYTSPTYTR